jgi:hypothetical protein
MTRRRSYQEETLALRTDATLVKALPIRVRTRTIWAMVNGPPEKDDPAQSDLNRVAV